jgi:NAD(P)-dependent dehydrogenase (short-subunit alcohol dehydrogenase family)
MLLNRVKEAHVTAEPATTNEHPLMKEGLGRLREKVAIVTGADSGIGRATARLFAREGAKVVCLDRWESGTPRIDELIESEGGQAVFVKGDVTVRSDWQRTVDLALSKFGAIHILHSHAGDSTAGKIHEVRDDEWDRVLRLNLNGIRYGTEFVIQHFVEQSYGNIIITASSHGILGVQNSAAYCATKAALINLTRQMALDYGPAVRVNCVCPGPIDTPRLRGWPPAPSRRPDDDERRSVRVRALKRLGRPEEVAYAVLFLASDESSYITGHPLVIDGGQTIGIV